MPNWCTTTYHFRGSENELIYLSNKVREWTSKPLAPNGFGNSWLGNILHGAGLGDLIDNPEDEDTVNCRGSLIEVSEPDHGYFSVITETAWVPMAKMWYKVIEHLGLKSVGFAFAAEEPGCGIYWIYDPNGYGDFLNDEVYIDSYGNIELDSINDYYRKADAVEVLNDFFKTELGRIEDFIPLCERYNEEHEEDDYYINVHTFEVDNDIGE